MYQDQFPHCRRVRARHDSPELLGNGRQSFRNECGAGSCHYERKDRLTLRRDHGQWRFAAQFSDPLIEQPSRRRAGWRYDERYFGSLQALEWIFSRANRSRRENEDELLGAQGDSRERVRDIDGVSHAELAGTRFDQGEEVVAVLRGGQVHADTRVVPSEFTDHRGRRVGGQGRQTGQGKRTRQQPGHRRHGGTPGFKVTQDLASWPE